MLCKTNWQGMWILDYPLLAISRLNIRKLQLRYILASMMLKMWSNTNWQGMWILDNPLLAISHLGFSQFVIALHFGIYDVKNVKQY